MNKSAKTIKRHFDHFDVEQHVSESATSQINLILDATFFSRSDGVLIFRANKKNLHWRFIRSETLNEISQGLTELEGKGFSIQSVILDGRRGVIKLFEQRYPGIPIQMCQFHQAQIIRRYTTNNPKTECGKALKLLMQHLTEVSQEVFTSLLETLREEYAQFLKERNDQHQFMHRRLRSAFRSLKSNLPYLFTYKNHFNLNISNTTNSCDGSFAHWKQKVKIHRGLTKKRRDKMINYLLSRA